MRGKASHRLQVSSKKLHRGPPIPTDTMAAFTGPWRSRSLVQPCPKSRDRTTQPVPSRPALVPKTRALLVPEGDRHEYMRKAGGNLVRRIRSERELIEALAQIRDWESADLALFSDNEVAGIASRWFVKRWEDRLFGGRKSEF